MVTNLAGSIVSSDAALPILAASPGQFQAPLVQSDGSLQLVLLGNPGAMYFMQSSTNLVN